MLRLRCVGIYQNMPSRTLKFQRKEQHQRNITSGLFKHRFRFQADETMSNPLLLSQPVRAEIRRTWYIAHHSTVYTCKTVILACDWWYKQVSDCLCFCDKDTSLIKSNTHFIFTNSSFPSPGL
jgi:hypothetical protein